MIKKYILFTAKDSKEIIENREIQKYSNVKIKV